MWGPSGDSWARVSFKHAVTENSRHPSVLFTRVGAGINTGSQDPAKINVQTHYPGEGSRPRPEHPWGRGWPRGVWMTETREETPGPLQLRPWEELSGGRTRHQHFRCL